MSYRRLISAALLPAVLLLLVTGCTKTVWIGPEEVQPEDVVKLKGVVTADGQEVALEQGEASIRGDTLYADLSGETVRFALEDLLEIGVVRSDGLGTVLLVVGIVAATAAAVYGIMLAIAISNID